MCESQVIPSAPCFHTGTCTDTYLCMKHGFWYGRTGDQELPTSCAAPSARTHADLFLCMSHGSAQVPTWKQRTSGITWLLHHSMLPRARIRTDLCLYVNHESAWVPARSCRVVWGPGNSWSPMPPCQNLC